jgi:hypothetical protein
MERYGDKGGEERKRECKERERMSLRGGTEVWEGRRAIGPSVQPCMWLIFLVE